MIVAQMWFYCEVCKDGGRIELLANERVRTAAVQPLHGMSRVEAAKRKENSVKGCDTNPTKTK